MAKKQKRVGWGAVFGNEINKFNSHYLELKSARKVLLNRLNDLIGNSKCTPVDRNAAFGILLSLNIIDSQILNVHYKDPNIGFRDLLIEDISDVYKTPISYT